MIYLCVDYRNPHGSHGRSIHQNLLKASRERNHPLPDANAPLHKADPVYPPVFRGGGRMFAHFAMRRVNLAYRVNSRGMPGELTRG